MLFRRKFNRIPIQTKHSLTDHWISHWFFTGHHLSDVKHGQLYSCASSTVIYRCCWQDLLKPFFIAHWLFVPLHVTSANGTRLFFFFHKRLSSYKFDFNCVLISAISPPSSHYQSSLAVGKDQAWSGKLSHLILT